MMSRISMFIEEAGAPFKAFFYSKLALKVLVVNLVGPLALFIGMIISDNYEITLINSEAEHVFARSEQIVSAIKQNALRVDYIPIKEPQKSLDIEKKGGNPIFATNKKEVNVISDSNYDVSYKMSSDDTRFILKNYITDKEVRYRIFDASGRQKADSKYVLPFNVAEGLFQEKQQSSNLLRYLISAYKNFTTKHLDARRMPEYVERISNLSEIKEATKALELSDKYYTVRYDVHRGKILSLAVPIRFVNQNVGVLLADTSLQKIQDDLLDVRETVLILFLYTLLGTGIISLYLSATILHPLSILSRAAKNVHLKKNDGSAEFAKLMTRQDEIGTLSFTIRAMVASIQDRLGKIEQFAADVAHELKNPLSSIQSAIETLAVVRQEEKKEQLLNVIKDDVDRMNRLITDISNLSRIDSELSKIDEKEPIEVKKLVMSILEAYMSAPPVNKNMQYIVDWDEDVEYTKILCSRRRFAQVVDNLLSNAISFSPEEGGEIKIKANKAGDFIRIYFEDNGIGIAPNKEKTIFQRFYSDRAKKDAFGSHSGLGLAICKQIVKAVGGKIRAENVVVDGKVKGARFIVSIPRL